MKDSKKFLKPLSFLCQKHDSEYFFSIPYITGYYQAEGIPKISMLEVKIK